MQQQQQQQQQRGSSSHLAFFGENVGVWPEILLHRLGRLEARVVEGGQSAHDGELALFLLQRLSVRRTILFHLRQGIESVELVLQRSQS